MHGCVEVGTVRGQQSTYKISSASLVKARIARFEVVKVKTAEETRSAWACSDEEARGEPAEPATCEADDEESTPRLLRGAHLTSNHRAVGLSQEIILRRKCIAKRTDELARIPGLCLAFFPKSGGFPVPGPFLNIPNLPVCGALAAWKEF